jgi:cytochrome c oxidase cbb3-type subunit III
MIRTLALTVSLTLIVSAAIVAQAPPPTGGRGGRQGGAGAGRGPNFPQQQRPLADAAVLARGKGLFEANCSACHGIDLRGGQQGGPNLLRSQTVLLDKSGELIGPIVIGGRPNPAAGAPPMPPFALPPADVTAIAEYIHSVAAQAGRQGRPPVDENVPPEKILVGDPAAGKAYFDATCSKCHSLAGDLVGFVARAADARELQNAWVSGGGGGGRGGRGGRGSGRVATATVTPASGPAVSGRLLRLDDFTVSVLLEDGSRRTFSRNGADPRVEIQDPAEAHRRLVMALADKEMHDVTAYLWSLR